MNLQHLLSAALKSRYDEDMLDKFNNKLTSYLMFALGLSIFAQEYAGDPLKCWSKPSWEDHWLQYAEDYCFIEGTYAIKLNHSLPHRDDLWQYKKVTFYQWIPFIFYLMGIMLQLPRFFWSFINWTSYLHLTGFCNVAVNSFRQHLVHKKGDIEVYVNHFEDAINRKCKKSKVKKSLRKLPISLAGYWDSHVSPKYLFISYLLLKLWQIANTLVLLVILNRLIADQHDDWFGITTISKLVYGQEWPDSDIFPRVTVCNFQIREMAKNLETELATKTAQCVLSAHMFVEKFFIFVWFWLVFLCFANCCGFLLWCTRFLNGRADSFLKEFIVSGIDFVDFLKPEQERLRKEDEAIKEQVHKLILAAAEDAAAAAEAEENDKPDNNNDNGENKGKKKQVISHTVINMEEQEAKKEKVQKGLQDCEERYKELQKRKHMTEGEKKAIIEKEKSFYTKNIDGHVSGFRKNLGRDGLLTLYMISINASNTVAAQIVSQFFFDHLKKVQQAKNVEIQKVNDFAPSYENFVKKPKGAPFDDDSYFDA
uniref:Innexin n=1 Tax=Panagrolaimus sp. ES5 TaxID=591445 RepID=A0AC34GWQ2_9BILA